MNIPMNIRRRIEKVSNVRGRILDRKMNQDKQNVWMLVNDFLKIIPVHMLVLLGLFIGLAV